VADDDKKRAPDDDKERAPDNDIEILFPPLIPTFSLAGGERGQSEVAG